MQTPLVSTRPRPPNSTLLHDVTQRVVGQTHSIAQIVPYVEMHRAGLAPDGRPAGVFLLLGPTGTGKTRTVEALAEVLHGSARMVLRVDCGEFQLEHEVAKLIGAPPGYLGHRETTPMLNQQKLSAVTSESSNLSLVLLDEIEKAAPSMARLLLGVLDKATLRLGDNTAVNFEKSLIFMTSNLGAREMAREIRPDFGFEALVAADRPKRGGVLTKIGMGAVRRRFSPEFINRIDAIITYQPLGEDSLAAIVDQQIAELEQHIQTRMGDDAFELDVTAAARAWLLREGTSDEYGARELKRVILRHVTQPMAAMVVAGEILPEDLVKIDTGKDLDSLRLTVT